MAKYMFDRGHAGRRDLSEALFLSLAAHLIFVLFFCAARPQISPHSLQGDLFYRIEEPAEDTALIGAQRAGAGLIPFAPKIGSVPPAMSPPESEGLWMNQMPALADKATPTFEQECADDAEEAFDVGALDSWRERRGSVERRAHHLMRHFQSAALTPLVELDSDKSLNAFRFYCASPTTPEEFAPARATRNADAALAVKKLDLAVNVRDTLSWLTDDRATKRAPGLALQALAPTGTPLGIAAPMVDDEGQQLANSENFLIDVHVHRRFSGKGVLFEAKFCPKPEVAFREIRQNFLFLIDRSSSINPKRFAQFKEAVVASLEQLPPSDTFNIVFFDKRSARFAPESLPCTPENIAAARAFIQGEKCGGFFSSTDLYTSLERIVPQDVTDDEVVSVMLLSDGDSRLSRERQRRTIAGFSAKNQGKVSLFALACGENNNLPLLELLTFFNRGQLCYCRDGQKLPEHLQALVQSLRFPIGKEMLASAIDLRGAPTPHLLSPSGQQTNLHRGLLHTVIGSCAQPEAFYLFLQGRHCGDWLDIKSKVSAAEIEPPSPELERRYLVLLAFEHYGNYLQTGDLDQLRAAKEMLTSLGYFAAFR